MRVRASDLEMIRIKASKMISLEDYNAIEETMMRSSNNATKLRESLEQYKNSNIKQHGLIQE
jgi:PHD/YefM family antitoxin component YafN of YafNO toxin-antitoxin module